VQFDADGLATLLPSAAKKLSSDAVAISVAPLAVKKNEEYSEIIDLHLRNALLTATKKAPEGAFLKHTKTD
jgi:hypothetical protein